MISAFFVYSILKQVDFHKKKIKNHLIFADNLHQNFLPIRFTYYLFSNGSKRMASTVRKCLFVYSLKI